MCFDLVKSKLDKIRASNNANGDTVNPKRLAYNDTIVEWSKTNNLNPPIKSNVNSIHK